MSRSPRLLFFLLLFVFLVFSVSAHSGHGDDDGGNDAGTPDEEKPDLRSRTLILAKIWCLIIIFFATFLAGVSPYVLKWNESFLVLGTQFAGGVFLGTAMMHFLSDANETFQDLTKKEYPFAFMLACVGYLITMLADCTISTVFVQHNSGAGYGADVELQGDKANNIGAISQSQLQKNASCNCTDGITKVKLIIKASLIRIMPSGAVMNNGNARNATLVIMYLAAISCSLWQQARNGFNAHLANPAFASTSSLGDSILLIIALCFHSVFEGIAIGVAENKDDAYKALWTISLHKVFAAIAMGIALLRMIPNRPLLSCAAYSFAFAISSPIGVAIGIIIDATTQGAVADWIFAISMGLACGVFIFVSINHLFAKGYIPQKPVKVDTAFPKFLAVLLGVGVIAVVMIWDT